VIEGNENLRPGTIVEGNIFDTNTPNNQSRGILLQHDTSDNSMLIIFPEGDGEEWEFGWLSLGTAYDISDTPEGRAIHDAFPLANPTPGYIFMVIRPRRKITTYANLDALIEGMFKEGERVSAERKDQIREAAAQAIADPETDIKIPPGASNSPWLRFTQVEGA
jgi:hypothetical protein